MNKELVMSKLFRWSELFFFDSNCHIPISSINVFMNHDHFVSCDFMVHVRFDIQERVMKGDIPEWAIQLDGFAFNECAVYQPQIMYSLYDPTDRNTQASIKLPDKLYFQRHYNIGVPFTMISTPSHSDQSVTTELIERTAIKWAKHYLLEGDDPNGKIARFEVPQWSDFPY